jgi:hypothetical protein
MLSTTPQSLDFPASLALLSFMEILISDTAEIDLTVSTTTLSHDPAASSAV